MKILNLYSGLGGNRKLWGSEHAITSVENNQEIANAYASFFPQDNLIIGDAHSFLLEHFRDYDFIWSSPPCVSHSGMRQNLRVRFNGTPPIYPDLKLYEEILFLKHNFKGLWVVENVSPYYKPLIPAVRVQRHLFWSNFYISPFKCEPDHLRDVSCSYLQKRYGFDVRQIRIENKRQCLRNCVLPELGAHILSCALNKKRTRQEVLK